MSYKVFLVDDRDLITEGLKALLSNAGDMEVIGSAGSGSAAREKIKALFTSGGIGALPDVVVMDMVAPGVGGAEAIRVIKRDFPMIRIMALVGSNDYDMVYEAVKEGASGYLPVNSSHIDIADGVRVVANGGAIIEADVANRVMAMYASVSKGQSSARSFDASQDEVTRADNTLRLDPLLMPDDHLTSYDLTEKEMEVATRVGQGKNDMEIGNEVYMSENTVSAHVEDILRKLDLKDRVQLANYAIKHFK
jgi:DNA-binding NarL/FixJ family response regulator